MEEKEMEEGKIEELTFTNVNDMFEFINYHCFVSDHDFKIISADSSSYKAYLIIYKNKYDFNISNYIKISLINLSKSSEDDFKKLKYLDDVAKNKYLEENPVEKVDDIFIFVDGELYKGEKIIANKGIGWCESSEIYLEKHLAARYQKVHLVDIKNGKLRLCKYNSNGMDLKRQLQSETTCWLLDIE